MRIYPYLYKNIFMTPFDKKIYLDKIPMHGRFGAERKHDIHTGLDLYCLPGDQVYAIEDGVVVNVCDFTGSKADSPWWRDTKAVLVKGKSGVLLYGEIETDLEAGEDVEEGDLIGIVKTVLKVDKGLPMTMLHMELYDADYTGDGEWWPLEQPQPAKLRNIDEFLWKVDDDCDPYLKMIRQGLTDEEIAESYIFGSYYVSSIDEKKFKKEMLDEYRAYRANKDRLMP